LSGLNENTKVLLHLDGSDGATSTVDATGRHGTINFQGTAELDTAEKKWGTASLLLDGNSDYLDIPDSADWDTMGGTVLDEWTIDFWVKHTDHVSIECYIGQYEDANNYWYLRHSNLSGINFKFEGSEATTTTLNSTGEITDTNWHHIAFCRVSIYSGGIWRYNLGLYLDGVQVSYLGLSTSDYLDTIASSLYVGQDGNSANYFDGRIDEIRIHKSNYFSANPNGSLTDTITVPTKAYSRFTRSQGIIIG